MGRVKKDAFDAAPRDLGRYRLHGEIAAGGMATVHFGRQVGSGGFSKTVAIKRLHPQFGKMPEFVAMFLAEARMAARIRHPNVVQPLDVLTVDEELFLVMEYVEGDSLSRLMRATLARKERVPVSIAISILCGVLHGLHAAHEAKSDKGEPLELVHRDVSPQNVLVGIDGVARVIDFGIAKAADSVQFTRDGELKGKLSYMAPEQLNGHRCSRRSDIYAASVILWEVLTAQRLFDADYQSAILENILHRPVDPPSDVVPDLPKALDVIVLKGLARDPSDRFLTARDMAIALEDSVPMATQSSVGSWVEVVAAKSLGERAARVAQIESVPSTGPPDGSAAVLGSEALVPARSDPPPSSSPKSLRTAPSATEESRRPPTTAPTPPPPIPAARRSGYSIPPSVPTARGVGIPVGSAPPAASARRSTPGLTPDRPGLDRPTPDRPIPVRPASQPERADVAVLAGDLRSTSKAAFARTQASSTEEPQSSTRRPPPPTIDVSEPTSVPPQWPVPGIMPVAANARIVFEPAKRSSGGGVLGILLLIVLAVVGFYFVLPEFLKRGYASGAERAYGVTLSIDRVVVSFRQIRLIGVNASAREIPGVSLRCKEVVVALTPKLSPSEMTAYDVVVTLDGAYPTLIEAESRWSLAHVGSQLHEDGTLQHLKVDSGQLLWTRPFGEQTRLSAENVTVEAERAENRPLGDDYEIVAPIVDLTDGSGKIGPWPVKVTTTSKRTRAIVSFDATGASRAQAVVDVWDGSLASIEVTVPRTPFAQLGIESAVLGLHQDQPFFVEGDAEYTARSAARIEGHVRMTASGVHVNGSSAPSQVDVDLHLGGDPKGPVEWGEGTIAVGALRTRPTGNVTVGAGSARAELVWKSGGGRCPGGGEQSFTTTVRLDSRNLDGSSWAVGGSRCARTP
jgi:serine/threonine protein kinase